MCLLLTYLLGYSRIGTKIWWNIRFILSAYRKRGNVGALRRWKYHVVTARTVIGQSGMLVFFHTRIWFWWRLLRLKTTNWRKDSAAFQPTTSSQAISTANLLITLITQPRKEFKHGNFMSVVSYSGIREGEPSHGCSNAQRGWNTVNTVAVENIIKAGYSLFSKLSDHFIIPTRISTVFDQWHWGFSKLRFACGFCIKDLYRAAP